MATYLPRSRRGEQFFQNLRESVSVVVGRQTIAHIVGDIREFRDFGQQHRQQVGRARNGQYARNPDEIRSDLYRGDYTVQRRRILCGQCYPAQKKQRRHNGRKQNRKIRHSYEMDHSRRRTFLQPASEREKQAG